MIVAPQINFLFNMPPPAPLSGITEGESGRPQAGQVLQQLPVIDPRSQGRVGLVASSDRSLERQGYFQDLPRPGDQIRCESLGLGGGVSCEEVSTGRLWSLEEASLPINSLELLAGAFAIRSLGKDRVCFCVLLKMDNISAVRYINRLGGTRSLVLARLAREFWDYCLQWQISIQAEYIPGVSNVTTDWHCRYWRDTSDWTLHRRCFDLIQRALGPCKIDLFATCLNRQLEQFYSWKPDPDAVAMDAFLQSWEGGLGYAFPPFSMIARTLAHQEASRINSLGGASMAFPSLVLHHSGVADSPASTSSPDP
nr:PREDICTED: uncharacterized protein LOC106705246 [Latimeria chalumnae]|eukprot:XP_014349589.1 PREDICTED: uncharacterized protein LOC106705246 [Latimeria chalumnae]